MYKKKLKYPIGLYNNQEGCYYLLLNEHSYVKVIMKPLEKLIKYIQDISPTPYHILYIQMLEGINLKNWNIVKDIEVILYIHNNYNSIIKKLNNRQEKTTEFL